MDPINTDSEVRQINLAIDAEDHKEIRRLSVEREVRMAEIIREALKEYLARQKAPAA